jgi:hypothetical protein
VVNVSVLVAGVAVDPCRVPLPLSITHGRSTVASQPDAPECSWAWEGATPPGVLGDDVLVTIEDAGGAVAAWDEPAVAWDEPAVAWDGTGAGLVRFSGTIHRLTAAEDGGQVVGWQVSCIGHQATLAVRPVLLDRPQETDVARVLAIAAAAGVEVTIVGPGGLTLAADAIDTNALNALQQVASMSGGLVWQATDGALMYGTLGHRDAEYAAQVIRCVAIEDGIGWEDDLELVTNHVTLKFGAEGSQTEDTWRDDASITQWGMRHVDFATLAVDRSQAGVLGAAIVARRAQPYWRSPGVVLIPEEPADDVAVGALEVSQLVALPIPYAPGPTPADVTLWFIEGWVEAWDVDGRTVQLAASDATRSTTAAVNDWAQVALNSWQVWAPWSWMTQLIGTE